MKILLVDDSRVARCAVRKSIELFLPDATFIEADDGKSAWQAIDDETPDLIFTDWYMDSMSGLDLIISIRGSGNQTKVCMVTSETNTQRLNMARSCGADYILSKPIQLEELKVIIDNLRQ